MFRSPRQLLHRQLFPCVPVYQYLSLHPIYIYISDIVIHIIPQITRNLNVVFDLQSTIHINGIPRVTKVLLAPPLLTDGIVTNTVRNQDLPIHSQFRLTPSNIGSHIQAHTLDFTIGGYFAPLSAPLYSPPHTYNSVTGLFINAVTTSQVHPSEYQTKGQHYEAQRNQYATQLGGPS